MINDYNCEGPSVTDYDTSEYVKDMEIFLQGRNYKIVSFKFNKVKLLDEDGSIITVDCDDLNNAEILSDPRVSEDEYLNNSCYGKTANESLKIKKAINLLKENGYKLIKEDIDNTIDLSKFESDEEIYSNFYDWLHKSIDSGCKPTIDFNIYNVDCKHKWLKNDEYISAIIEYKIELNGYKDNKLTISGDFEMDGTLNRDYDEYKVTSDNYDFDDDIKIKFNNYNKFDYNFWEDEELVGDNEVIDLKEFLGYICYNILGKNDIDKIIDKKLIKDIEDYIEYDEQKSFEDEHDGHYVQKEPFGDPVFVPNH